MTGRKNRVLQVPPIAPYKALENFSKVLHGTTRGTCSARFFRDIFENPRSINVSMMEKFIDLGFPNMSIKLVKHSMVDDVLFRNSRC